MSKAKRLSLQEVKSVHSTWYVLGARFGGQPSGLVDLHLQLPSSVHHAHMDIPCRGKDNTVSNGPIICCERVSLRLQWQISDCRGRRRAVSLLLLTARCCGPQLSALLFFTGNDLCMKDSYLMQE